MLTESALVVRGALEAAGLETPMLDNGLSNEQKKQRLTELMTQIVHTLGLDLTDDSLAETPARIAKMYVDEVFSGLDYSTFPKISMIDNKMRAEEMVKVQNISFTSTCEHHFVTIDGTATVAYIPGKKDYWFVETESYCEVFCPASAGAGAFNSANSGGFAGFVGCEGCGC